MISLIVRTFIVRYQYYTINFRYKNVTQSELFFVYKNVMQNALFFAYKIVTKSDFLVYAPPPPKISKTT